MKDHVEIGHLTKYDAFRMNRETKLWTLKYSSKSIQTSLILRQCPPKSYKLLIFFYDFRDTLKMSKHSAFHLIFFQIEGAWQDFTVATKLIQNFKTLYGFGGRFLKIRDVCMDFEPHFKVHNLVSVHPKSIIVGQMTNLNMVFHVVVSVYRLVQLWNSPQFPDELWNGQYLFLLPSYCLGCLASHNVHHFR